MKKILAIVLPAFVRFLLSLRYHVEVKGKERLTPEALPKDGGILFLSNHTAEIDPIILLAHLWHPYKPHPVAMDYLFRMPVVGWLLRFVGAFPIPNFDASSNSYKRKEIEKTFQQIISALDRKENLLIYPSGGLKTGPEEVIGGSSGTARILGQKPNVNVVLIRISGLWGSTFSKAPTGKTPALGRAFFNGFKVLLRNGLFFAPRRKVTVEIIPAPTDFPWKGSRFELNRYLEGWYNENGPEPLYLVSFSHFRKVIPEIKPPAKAERVSIDAVPYEIKAKVIEEIAKLARVSSSQITPDSTLTHDLGFDSLDMAQLVIAIKEQFGLTSLNSSDLTTVASVIAFAAKVCKSREEENSELKVMAPWEKETNRPLSSYPEGETIPSLFFATCERMGAHVACVDSIAGEISYKQLKMGVLILAETIRKLPGEHIGIMMPASVAVNALILATMIAGKIPVMINWTLGERNLRSVIESSGIQVTLSSWNFIDRLDNVELNGIDEQLIFFEDIRKKITLGDKIKGYYRSRLKEKSLLKKLRHDPNGGHNTAVILFTSGTESFPKGVPLSHKNIISNQRAAYSLAKIESSDVLLGALPAFHSFGFSVTGLFPLLAGLKVAYTPNPTDGKRMAEAVERWNITLLCLAPTFLKNLLRAGTENQLRSLRLVVSGAEKMPADIATSLTKINPKAILIEGYGITECSPILTLNPPDAPMQGVGVALPGIDLLIVDPESHEPLPLGDQGLILARGPSIFSGYLDSHLTSPFLDKGGHKWYITGDLGYLDRRSYLTLSGRLKRFVKIGGEMVSLAAIEETLLQELPKRGRILASDLPSLAVCSFEKEGKKGEIHLFTTLELTAEEANQILRSNGMSNIIKLRSVKKLPFIPLLGSGKIDYRRLTSTLES